ncbi:MAG: hypothetical protein IPK10_02680 [Bacteroidetes bacterium]|nr:hypothetical protein [Bacteroidota bacterium]
MRLSLLIVYFQDIMESTKEKIEALVKLVKELNQQHQQLLRQLGDEKKKHQQSLVDKQNLEIEVLQLNEQVKTIKLAQAIQGSNDQSTHELKNQINRYIREIDKCLQLINSD